MAAPRESASRVMTAPSYYGLTVDLLADWINYETRNTRANVEYRNRPAIVPLIVESLERHGLGVTCVRFGVGPQALASWFPDLIEGVIPEEPGGVADAA